MSGKHKNFDGGKDRKEKTIKKRHGVFFGFAVLLITAIFTLVGCDNGGGGNDEPELAKWAGTWNAIDQYLDDAQLSQIWTDGASYINTNFAGKNATAQNLKGLFKYMLKTDFKSCVIADDTMKIYNTLNASGSPSATIVYTYKGSGEGEYSDWSKFEGNTVGQFKYLLVNPRHQDNPGSMEHFHLQYNAESFDKATENPMWVATVTPTSTTITAIKEELETLFEEFPWDQIPAEMLAQFNEPELAEWAGTWNAVDQYLDDVALSQMWTTGASYVNANFTGKNATAGNLKGFFKYMLRTDFKSCIIADDTMKIYSSLNASGSPSETIAYTYIGPGEGEDADWSKFEGNTAGQFKYLLVNPRHQDRPGSMEHFHLKYSAESFDKATENPIWAATVTPKGTTITAIKEELETYIEEAPWDMVTAEMLAQFN